MPRERLCCRCADFCPSCSFSATSDPAEVAKTRRVGSDVTDVVVMPVSEPRVWSIADDGKETLVATLDPDGLVQHLNKKLYREREWGKKRDIFADDDTDQTPQHEPGVLAVAAQLAYARFEMETLAVFATHLAQGKRLQPDHVLEPPRPLEGDELQRKAGRVWARKLAFRSAANKLRDAATRVRDAGQQGTLFFADIARLRPAWSMRLRRRTNSDALELLVRADAWMTPEAYQWVPLQWSNRGVVLELAPLFQLFCNGVLAGGEAAIMQTHTARGADEVHRLLLTLRVSFRASCVFRMLSDAANKAVGGVTETVSFLTVNVCVCVCVFVFLFVCLCVCVFVSHTRKQLIACLIVAVRRQHSC